jgi:ElaB/YqjD/DUF883 family membrane-anchored ribosome-binding protein
MFQKENSTAAAKDNMVNEGGHAANDANAAAGHSKKSAQESARAIKEDLEEIARRAGCHARELADSAGDNIEDIGENLTGKIRKKPIQSIAAAVGIGVVCGILFRR